MTLKPKFPLKALLKAGYAFDVVVNERSTIYAVLQLSTKDAKKRGLAAQASIGRARASLPAAGSRKLTVRIPRKVAKKLRGARGLVMTLRVTATDASGNFASRAAKVRLR